jgi:hypothetical protein
MNTLEELVRYVKEYGFSVYGAFAKEKDENILEATVQLSRDDSNGYEDVGVLSLHALVLPCSIELGQFLASQNVQMKLLK